MHGGQQIPPIVEMPRKAEVERGAVEQHVATHQRGICTQVDTYCQQCH